MPPLIHQFLTGPSLFQVTGRHNITPLQVGKMLATLRGGSRPFSLKKTHLVGLVSPFGDLSWNLAIIQNSGDVFAGLNQARDQIVLITILLTIAIGGTATIVASQIIIPLQTLTEGIMQVGRGDLEVVVPIHRDDN